MDNTNSAIPSDIESLSQAERLQLKQMISESGCKDHTDDIRRLRHSSIILENVSLIEKLKRKHADLRETNKDEFELLCQREAKFLYTYYTDIFINLLRDEINLGILCRMLRVLAMIEDGQVDQHEASVMVGKYLKEMYVDTALRRGKKLDEKNGVDDTAEPVYREAAPTKLSWKQYKVGKPTVSTTTP